MGYVDRDNVDIAEAICVVLRTDRSDMTADIASSRCGSEEYLYVSHL